MRRGLMEWNAQELPVGTLDARIARLRAAMARQTLDAFILYTNNVRPAAVTWLTGFVPYWSEGLLLVPRDGRLVFATALSNRVADWIRANNPVSEVTSTPKPGALLGERLAKSGVKRAGILEWDALPSALADELAAAAVEFRDGTALFAELRRTIDDDERKLIMRADAIAAAALDPSVHGTAQDAGTLAGLVEQHARLAGAEEAYIAVAADLAKERRLIRTSQPLRLGERYAVRASVAYKGSWVRRVRTFAPEAAQADAWLADVARTLEPGKPFGAQLAAQVAKLGGASMTNWLVESCTGSYPLSPVASSRSTDKAAPVDGGFTVLTVELMRGDAPWIGAAPLFV